MNLEGFLADAGMERATFQFILTLLAKTLRLLLCLSVGPLAIALQETVDFLFVVARVNLLVL